MGQLNSFTFITLNGYYKGSANDISWHNHGGEEAEFAADSSGGGSTLLFGRVTYEMMAGFWPTPMAHQSNPVVAANMNKAEKIVFSKTLKKADWNNTHIISADIVEQVHKLKQQNKNFTILGSGSILTQLANAGLVDSFSFMLDPVAIGKGTTVFNDIQRTLKLGLVSSRVFKSGVILLNYKPV